jgi:hypothetical protein
MVAAILLLYFFLLALFAGFLVLNSVLVFNSVRYMAVAPDSLWRDARYFRTLPSLLKHLYDEGFASPWPARPWAFSAWKFRRRMLKALKGKFPEAGRLIQHPLNRWASVQFHSD